MRLDGPGSAAKTTPTVVSPKPTANVTLKLPTPDVVPKPTKPLPKPSVQPPRIDMSALSSAVATKKDARETNATVSRQLVFTMALGGNTWNFNMPIKYRIWISDKSAQSAEITVEIPIKVFNGLEGLNYWKSKGYAESDYSKTIHGGKKPDVIGATATDEVKKMDGENQQGVGQGRRDPCEAG